MQRQVVLVVAEVRAGLGPGTAPSRHRCDRLRGPHTTRVPHTDRVSRMQIREQMLGDVTCGGVSSHHDDNCREETHHARPPGRHAGPAGGIRSGRGFLRNASVTRPLRGRGDLPGAGRPADHPRGGGVLGSADPQRRRSVRRHRGPAGGLTRGPGRDRDQGHRRDPAAGRHRGDPQRRLRRRHHRRATPPAARRAAVGSHQRSRSSARSASSSPPTSSPTSGSGSTPEPSRPSTGS